MPTPIPDPFGGGTSDPWIPTDGVPYLTAVPITVYRAAAPETEGDLWTLTAMSSLECVDVTRHSGAKPSTARFAYKFGDGVTGSPQNIEQALSDQINLTKTVKPGDRLLVRATKPDGSWEWIFDGFPYGFEAILHEDGEEVVLACAGVEKRLWDTPIPGMILRNGTNPGDPLLAPEIPNHAQTDLKAVFNLAGKKNCTPEATDYDPHEDPLSEYPVFLDPDIVPVDPELVSTYWTLPKSVAYLAYGLNDEEEFVKNPDRAALDHELIAREPKDGEVFDPADPTTYDEADIVTPELPITGRFWPVVVEGLIGDKGFQCHFGITTPDPAKLPETKLEVYLQSLRPRKDLWLQAQNTALDLRYTNIGDCHLTRDIAEATNRWEVRGAPDRHQVAIVLACGWPSDPGHSASPTDIDAFAFSRITAANRNHYRLYIADECGEGHYRPHSATKLTDAFDFKPIFGDKDEDGKPLWVVRRRPCLGNLFPFNDTDRKLVRATLYYSTDYAGEVPSVWNGTGTWIKIQGGYDISHDRLAIWINIQNPEEWITGNTGPNGTRNILKGITSQSSIAAGAPPEFALKLECVIEADQCLKAVAERRDTAALAETVTRVVEASDRYWQGQVHTPITNLPTVAPRNDFAAAQAEAVSLRDATDAGVLDGPVTIPWFTTRYEISDRIERINGRNLGLRTDGGDDSTTAVLPSVRSIHWHLRGDQTTSLTISDGQQLRTSYKKRSHGRAFSEGSARGSLGHGYSRV